MENRGIICDKIGIDLGTTNSVVAIMRNGQIQVIVTPDSGDSLTPSVVSFEKEGEKVLTGKAAENKKGRNGFSVVFDVKRLFGKAFDDPAVGRWQNCVGVKVHNMDGRPALEIEHNGKRMLQMPNQISTHVLRKMRETAELYVRGCAQDREKPITEAVITVPAYFNQGQKNETKEAAHRAGFSVVQLITEPAAAAYAYGFQHQRFNGYNILVFDFGGGTFDVCVLEVKDGDFKVKMVKGDVNLGGRDFDVLLAEHLAERFEKICGKNAKAIPICWQKLVRICEELKKTLSFEEEESINDPFGMEKEVLVTRAKFEQLCEHLLQHSVIITLEALRDSGLKPNDIDELLLVGGTSRIPALSQMLIDAGFEAKKLNRSVKADEAVAVGAAILAAQMCKETKDKMPSMTLTEAIPLSLGIRVLKDEFSTIIPRNSSIPSIFTDPFCTTKNDQDAMSFDLYEGERKVASKNNFLGTFSISGLPMGIVGSISVDLTLELDRNGILHASAKCGDIVAQLELNYKPPETNVEKMIREAAAHREMDNNEVKCMRAKNDLIAAIERRKYKCVKKSILAICVQFERWLDANQQANILTLRAKLIEFNGKFLS